MALSEPVELRSDCVEATLDAARERLRVVLTEALLARLASCRVVDHAWEAASEFELARRRNVSREAERKRRMLFAAVVTTARRGSAAAWRACADVREVREGYLTGWAGGGAVAVV